MSVQYPTEVKFFQNLYFITVTNSFKGKKPEF